MIPKESIPNLLTGLRLAALPVLWGFALLGADVLVGLGIVFAWLTDALDGFLARRFNAQSAWGSHFDSIADSLVFASAIVWLVMLRPEFVQRHAVLLLVWFTIGAAAYLVGWIRFRRIADLHLYSAKAANGLGFLFVAYLFIFYDYPLAAFYVVIGVGIVAAVETLLAMLLLPHADAGLTTILSGWRQRSTRPAERKRPARTDRQPR